MAKTIDKTFSDAEGKLYNYNSTKIELKSLKIDLEYLEIDYKGCKAISYADERTGETYNISNTVESEVLAKERQIKDLESKINKKERQIRKIENALELLKEEEKRLVNFRYFSNRKKAPSWLDVGEEIGYSDKKCRAMRNDIINRIKTLI
ncbi:RNA polymerase subunit sigma [Intestinibacter bartlettii]|uniref:RNA polymerase subunit sigma n=1 Tax=Intestinibacter bartlettii TaxID=261299 RepID=UPI0024331666|nr:RNA polymerase subunit sigma [Intestinibacter bartlettii]